MNIRPDVAELLRAGLSDRAIARQLHVDRGTVVAPARKALGLPTTAPRRPRSPEELFWQRAERRDDGHMTWTGARNNHGTPTLTTGGRNGKNNTAYRIAFRIAHGRDPEGIAGPACDVQQCVAPACQIDRIIRTESAKVDNLYAAIFGADA
ncbi:hypothetical protein ACFW6E_08760 [Streptomyces olivaceoviridis]|uniref:hypothetical protein n=1 Tax=Streptomyces olivaceoviridis TaxID=1921 RepID=UPI0036ACF6B7